ncbi:NYN domain-containing protein [Congregibacter litoralis]|nr:hypothetical protein [Congregibacter litoralis]
MSLWRWISTVLLRSSGIENPKAEIKPEGTTAEKGCFHGRSFVLDGTNIALLHGPKYPELRYVLAIAVHLRENGAALSCFFDANTLYLFRDHRREQEACFERLISEQPWAACFRVVPGGTQADPWILEQAKKDGADVISNDRFKDRAKAHRWIWKRRHGLEVDRGALQIPSLHLSLEPLARPEDYLRAGF